MENALFLWQLRQEYGYDLDPLNPHYAEKIAEKEKEFLKIEKEEKKKRRAEQARAKALEEASDKEAGAKETEAATNAKMEEGEEQKVSST